MYGDYVEFSMDYIAASRELFFFLMVIGKLVSGFIGTISLVSVLKTH